MHPLLPKDTVRGDKLILDHPITGQEIKRDSTGNAGIHTIKIRAVCDTCNNGWMNRLEAAARPHLTKMIEGRRFLLDQEAQLAVARWCAAKVIVAENAKGSPPLTPPGDRLDLAANLTIPEYFRIYITAHRCDAKIGYMRRASVISRSLTGPVPELDGMLRNIQQVTFLMGRAVVHVNASRAEGIEIEGDVRIPKVHKHARLWPSATDRLKWPGKAVLNFDEVQALANSITLITRGPNILYSGDPAFV